MPDNARWFSPPGYGLTTYRDLFTPRQLVALTTLSDLVGEVRRRVLVEVGDQVYADALALYLAFAVSRAADYGGSFASWRSKDNAMRSLFAQQAIPMVWDYAEGSPFGSSSSGFVECTEVVARCVERLPATTPACVDQLDATRISVAETIVCSDPPYYDNIGYADLSDFFYVWLRRSLNGVYPDLFSTLLTPKFPELVATPYRFDGDRHAAERFFERGLRETFVSLRAGQHSDYPLTLFLARIHRSGWLGDGKRRAARSVGGRLVGGRAWLGVGGVFGASAGASGRVFGQRGTRLGGRRIGLSSLS